MHGKNWSTSERQYDVSKREDVAIPLSDGTRLAADVFLPEGADSEDVPVLVGAHGYNKEYQTDAPLVHTTVGFQKGWVESGDPNFYVRRGYAMVNLNLRGTGKSEGTYRYGSPQEVDDTVEAIDWIADQEWCNGRVGFFGISYYAVNAQQVAARDPEPLECLFTPYGWTDWYRDMAYHGGILAKDWVTGWGQIKDNPRPHCYTRERLGEDAFEARVAEALADVEIAAAPDLVEALHHPNEHGDVVDIVLNYLDNDYWEERRVDYENTEVPAYLGADWRMYAFHLWGPFRGWEHWEGPVRMVLGPDPFLDRPLYQYHYESLRWFDHWLKDKETGILDEPPIKLFIPPTGEWVFAEEWPLPETKWTPFYLHTSDRLGDQSSNVSDVGLLSEHEIFDGEYGDTFADSPFDHGELRYETPPLLETTRICGPAELTLYASTTATEELFFATLYDVHPDGYKEEISRGWLRGSQRAVDPDRSAAGDPYHPHEQRDPLEPTEVYEFNIKIGPTAREFEPGHRIGLRIKGSDADDLDDDLDRIRTQELAVGHVETQTASRVTVYHNHDHPSHLKLPITKGNIVGTFMSGGEFPEEEGPIPFGTIKKPKSLPGDDK
jgi:predicted acyl esterase